MQAEMMGPASQAPRQETGRAHVHCPMCTHSVPAEVNYVKKRMVVKAGQKCPRCAASLDVAAVLYLLHAA
ncbi:MAG: hypothetical protein JWN34_4427 [Bryobacterales bacterium]|jgi:hypothetical protein|nr:hypothetical protein [Bryobacterales bacterium]